jgi:hypothetical protein
MKILKITKQVLLVLAMIAVIMTAGNSANAQCSISPSGAVALCTDGSVVLTADAGASYLWSNGETTQSITVTTAGSYNATIDGCPSNAVDVIAAAVSNSDPNLCSGSTTLTASGPSVNVTGNYFMGYDFDENTINVGPYNNVTGLSFGSSGYVHSHYGMVNFTVDLYNPLTSTWTTVYSNSTGGVFGFSGLTFTFPEISQISQMRLSSGPWQGYSFHDWYYSDLTFTQQVGSFSYLWNTGATTQTISVNTIGTYSVAINGCAAVSTTVTSGVPGNPTVFGQNEWKVYAWNSGGNEPGANTWNTNYAGYYTSTGLNLNTEDYWSAGASPSYAAGYAGCAVTVENHSWSAKRQGFPCGTYQLNIAGHDDGAQLWINGAMVWSHNGCCDAHNNVWTGVLSSTDQVEFRVTEGVGGSAGYLQLVDASGSITGQTTFCQGYSSTLTAPAGASSYLWNTGATTQSISVNTAGTFSITAAIGEACYVTSSVTTTVQAMPVPQFNFGSQNFCGTGYVDLDISNFNGAYQYTYSSGLSSEYAPYLYTYAAGTHTVTVTDALGCSASNSFTVSGPVGDPSVFGNNVWNVYAYRYGDIEDYGYSWNSEYYGGYYTESSLSFDTRDRWADGASPSYASGYQGCNVYEDYHSWSAKRQGFPAGTYTIDIPAHDNLAQLWINGTMVWSHSGWGDSHPAVWTGALNASSTVEFRVTEGDGGSYGAIAFTMSNPLVINNVSSPATYNGYNVSCTGGSNGSATVNASGGTAPLSYLWNNGQTTAIATGLAAGTYSVVVTDATGATATGSVTLTAPVALSVNAGTNETTYFGFSADQVLSRTATAGGGVGPYSFSWTMNRALKCNMVNTSGDETFTSGSCTFNSCPSTPLNTTMSSPPVCSGSATVSVKLIEDAVLTVTVTDANGCTATGSFTITSEDARCFSGNSNVQKVVICHHHNNIWAKLCVNEDAVADHLAHGDFVGSCTGNREEEIIDEASVSMLKAYPNPFSGKTTIAFSVPKDGNTVIHVFDAMGRQVGVLFDGMAKAGVMNKVEFDGEVHPAGIYFYSIVSEGMNEMKRMELVK